MADAHSKIVKRLSGYQGSYIEINGTPHFYVSEPAEAAELKKDLEEVMERVYPWRIVGHWPSGDIVATEHDSLYLVSYATCEKWRSNLTVDEFVDRLRWDESLEDTFLV